MTPTTEGGTDTWGRIADGSITAVLVASPLAVGTVHPVTWLGVWLLSAVALVTARSALDAPGALHPLMTGVIAAAGAAVAVSLVPLPPSVLEFLSPEAAAMWGLGPVGGDLVEAWRPWHQAPGPGRFQLLRWGALATFALACAARRCSFGALRVSITVSAAGLLTIAVAAAQTFLEWDRILGVYKPSWGFPTALRSTIVNPNHFGAYLGLVAVLSLGLLARRDAPAGARLLGLLTVAASALALTATGSRGGAMGTAVAFAALAILTALTSRGDRRRSTPAAVGVGVAGVAAPLLLLALWLRQLTPRFDAADTGLQRSLSETEARLGNLPQVLELLDLHRWTGVGRGAFVDVFPRFRESAGRVVFAHVEVLPLQLLVDHGVVVGALLMLMLGLVLVLCVRGALRRPSRAPAAAALVGLAAHELFDFSSETGAVLLTALLLVPLCLDRPARWGVRRWVVAMACIAAAAAVAVPHAGSWRQTADYQATVGDQSLPPEALQRASEEMWSRHPSSWFLALQFARAWANAGDLSMALQWTNRAMLLSPQQPDPHLLAARLLRRFGNPRQALGEYRLALVADLRVTGRAVVGEVSRGYEDPDALQRLRTPGRPDLDPWIAVFGLVLDDPRARGVAHDAWRELPDNQLAFVVEGWARAAEGRPDAALALLQEHQGRSDLTPYVRHNMARVAEKAGDTDLAVEYLEPILDGPDGPRREMWLLAGTWLVDLGRDADARRALRRARMSSRGVPADPETVSESLRQEARVAQMGGYDEQALELLERAEVAAPRRLEPGLDEVRLLWDMGRSDDSLARLTALAYLHGEDRRFRELARELGWVPPPGGDNDHPAEEPVRGGR